MELPANLCHLSAIVWTQPILNYGFSEGSFYKPATKPNNSQNETAGPFAAKPTLPFSICLFEMSYPKYFLFSPISPARPEPRGQTVP